MPLGDSLGLLAAVTALMAATHRYVAVLGRASVAAVERWTAVGFFLGLLLGAAVLLGGRSSV